MTAEIRIFSHRAPSSIGTRMMAASPAAAAASRTIGKRAGRWPAGRVASSTIFGGNQPAMTLEPQQRQGSDEEGSGRAKARERRDQRGHRFDDADQEAAVQRAPQRGDSADNGGG